MSLALSIFVVAFAAFCVWLTVRIVNRRERWAKCALTAVVGLPVLYVLSLGPACWISSHTDGGSRAVTVIYRPLLNAIDSATIPGPAWEPAWNMTNEYIGLLAADNWGWRIWPRWNEDGEYNPDVNWEYTSPESVP